VAAAANLCAIAVGTETDGSIVCPAGSNAIVGLKPTVGLVDQAGIVPIAHSQDTAGPMVRTVTDAAILLNALRSPFGEVRGRRLPRDYRSFLVRGALQGARIGVDRRLFDGGESTDAGLNAVTERALDAMRSLGATLIEPITPPDTKSINDDELTVLFSEFKVDIEVYLAGLRGTTLRTLGDLIAFNDEHCADELRFFGQELFHVADATSGLDDPAYRAARARCLAATRTGGIDRILAADRLDAIVGPAYGDSSAPAVSGYPAISIPTGTTDDGRPGGVWLSAGFLREPSLLGFAFDLESELGGRPRPTFAGTLPDLPPDAGICAVPVEERALTRREDLPDDT
jgi:amidase